MNQDRKGDPSGVTQARPDLEKEAVSSHPPSIISNEDKEENEGFKLCT